MAKRPALTEDTFLSHVFHPKKNAAPSGLRARALAFTKGRSKSRVTSYNRMSAINQEILKRSGLRESYLKGEVTLPQAKATLRPIAVSKGLTKPVRTRKGKVAPRTVSTGLDYAVGAHIVKALRDGGYPASPGTIHRNVRYLPEDVKPEVLKWDVGRIRAYAGDSENAVNVDFAPTPYNPLWYH